MLKRSEMMAPGLPSGRRRIAHLELAPCDGGRYIVQAESGDGGRYAGIVQAGSGAGLAPVDGGRYAGIVQAGSGAGLAPLDGGRYAGIVQAEPIKEGTFGGTQTL